MHNEKVGDKMLNIEESVEKIKSALFDIYEDQERRVGEIVDEQERDQYVAKYIEIKNKAIDLLEHIERIYHPESIENEQEIAQNISEPVLIESYPQEMPLAEEVETSVEQDLSNNSNIQVERFELDFRNGSKPNFAYVPQQLFERLRNNRIKKLTKIVENVIFKIDNEKTRGIIVRTDQYMKLILSKNRQLSVIRDAKNYRIEQARQARERLQQEQVKVKI